MLGDEYVCFLTQTFIVLLGQKIKNNYFLVTNQEFSISKL